MADRTEGVTKVFQLPTLGGSCIDFFAGVTYISIDNFVYCTYAFNASKMDIRANVVAGFPDDVTMINHSTDGLYIGTTKACYYLNGMGLERDDKGNVKGGFTQKQVSRYGVMKGSGLRIDGNILEGGETGRSVVLWTSPIGIMSGKDGGICDNLSDDRIQIPFGNSTQAASYLNQKEYGIYEYIVSFDSECWAFNIQSKTHARYTNFAFNSFFKLGADYYGSSSTGIYKIGGADDAGTKINAYALTPATDFGEHTLKAIADAYIFANILGEAELEIIADGTRNIGTYSFIVNSITGSSKHRCRTPKGFRGTTWQFKIKNVNGAQMYARQLEVQPLVTKRTV
jgi:hypothetical protein